MLLNSVFTIFWDFNIQCRVCYTACSVNRRETVSLFKFPIKSLMIPFELNWPVSLITIYILYVIITLHKYYVLTLELYTYLNYNLFSNNGNFSQIKSLFTNKLLMAAPPGSFIHISLRIGRPRISTKLGFYTQIMIICCILERDKHEHKWMILHFKPQPFFVVV